MLKRGSLFKIKMISLKKRTTSSNEELLISFFLSKSIVQHYASIFLPVALSMR
jgi:hypothetical protein